MDKIIDQKTLQTVAVGAATMRVLYDLGAAVATEWPGFLGAAILNPTAALATTGLGYAMYNYPPRLIGKAADTPQPTKDSRQAYTMEEPKRIKIHEVPTTFQANPPALGRDETIQPTKYEQLGLNAAENEEGGETCANEARDVEEGSYLTVLPENNFCKLAGIISVDDGTDLSQSRIKEVRLFTITEARTQRFDPDAFTEKCKLKIELANVPAGMFANCRKIQSVEFTSTGDVVINDSAFAGCSGLKFVSGTENVVEVGKSAFKGCSVEYLMFPKLQRLGGNAFANNDGLRGVRMNLEMSGTPSAPWGWFYGDLSEEVLISGGPVQDETYKRKILEYVRRKPKPRPKREKEVLRDMRKLMTENEIKETQIGTQGKENGRMEKEFLTDLRPYFDNEFNEALTQVSAAEDQQRAANARAAQARRDIETARQARLLAVEFGSGSEPGGG